ncbi:glutathione S-transferase omega-1-like [Ambystoma mexicanum]|uniref:glutathione S-transferase omega-1-like n=1 Tax=Ambystoma mexicanum TaxID=8296 RepID=UPI0037E85A52
MLGSRAPIVVYNLSHAAATRRKSQTHYQHVRGMAVSAKSWRKGSSPPGPVPEGLIRIYSMRFCPFAQRARLVLAAKGIKYETININLRSKPEWFLKKAPFGLVPVLETPKGEIIYESTITSEYLDEAYPEKKLTPSDPFQKAQQKMLLEHFNKLPPLMYKNLTLTRKGEDASVIKAELQKHILQFEEILLNKNTPYFGGDTVSMIDYMMWPSFERVGAFGVEDCLKDTPKLKSWMELMKEDPAVKETMMDPETMKAFFALYISSDSPDVMDFGLQAEAIP